jgi:DNA-binding beta-propeller fold protein YncE
MNPVRRILAIAIAIPAAIAACDETTGVEPLTGVETAVVLNSIDLSITVFPVDDPDVAAAIGLAAAGSPVSVAARGNTVVVPLGFFPAAAVVDLATGDVNTIPLPDNSGATGVAFLNDSIAYVANPNLGTVSVINVSAGTAGDEIEVGVFPQAVAVWGDTALVLNAELGLDYRPVRQGVVSAIDASSNTVVGSVFLTGFNPAAAAFGPDGLLYIVNSGAFGDGNGSLSVVNPATLDEVEHHAGFGEFPGDIALDDAGQAYISSFAYGIAVWDAVGDSFIDPPDDPLVVDGHTISSGVGVDSDGRLYTLIPGDCIAPNVAIRLDATLALDREIDVGVCPIAITFTRVEEQ